MQTLLDDSIHPAAKANKTSGEQINKKIMLLSGRCNLKRYFKNWTNNTKAQLKQSVNSWHGKGISKQLSFVQ